MIPVTTFAGKTVAVFGLGASGIATAGALTAGGATVAAWDDSEASRAAAETAGVPLMDLRAADWSRFAALVLAPGVPLTHPEPHWTVKAAKVAGVEVIGDIELFCRERRARAFQPDPDGFDIWLTAVTGTNGKSTTTALIAHILRAAGRDVQMGGNIGTPILALEPFARERHYVIECSSFQIDLAPSIDPSTAVLLNISADHLDRHGTIENYAAIKERLVRPALRRVISDDDPWCRAVADRIVKDDPGPFLDIFSVDHRLEEDSGRWIDEGVFKDGWPVSLNGWWREGLVIRRSWTDGGSAEFASLAGIGSLRGKHNAQNALAAVAASWTSDISFETVQKALSTFPGLPHRMEEIGRLGPVLFINDSKATNADSTEKALLSWERDIFWIAGGRPKEGGINFLAPLFPRVAKAYLIGEASDVFAATLAGHGLAFERHGTLDRAVANAARDAGTSTGEEPIVLLSPACASYDQFKNFEVRGEAFRAFVSALPNVAMRGVGVSDSGVVGSPPPSLPRKGGGTASSTSLAESSREMDEPPFASLDAIPPPLRGRLGGGEPTTPESEHKATPAPMPGGSPTPSRDDDDTEGA